MMRCGQLWGWQTYGIQPDIMVTAEGLSGGLYPISACLVNARAGGWLNEDGAAHISTTGGAELGCVVAHKVIEILHWPETIGSVRAVTTYFQRAMADMMQRHGDIFTGVRQRGVILGLEFNHPQGAVHVSRALYEHGVWAIFSSLDKRVLQWKPGILLTPEMCGEIVERFDAAMQEAAKLVEHIGKGGITAPKTIRDVCDNYAAHLRQNKTEKSAVDTERRFKSYVLDDVRFSNLEVSKLTPAHIDAWRKRLAARPIKQGMRGTKRKAEGYAVDKLAKLRTPSTLNRDMTPFRAALNLAFGEGWVTTDFAWRSKIHPRKAMAMTMAANASILLPIEVPGVSIGSANNRSLSFDIK